MIKHLAALCLMSVCCFADLTQEQKIADFLQLANLYAKNYAPYQWKRDVIGFDLYDGKPWLDQVKLTKTDPEFWDVCVRYVASLQDSHDEFYINSDYFTNLHFSVDIYDGKALIDGIDRTYLSRPDYPFAIGDELISVDGKPVADLIQSLIAYSANGRANPSTSKRIAASYTTLRIQQLIPLAYQTPDSSVIVVLRASGVSESYTIKWDKIGSPITTAGILESIRTTGAGPAARLRIKKEPVESANAPWKQHAGESDRPGLAAAWGVWQGDGPAVEVPVVPDYLKPLRELQQMSAFNPPDSASAGFGSFVPTFNPPAGFKLRLGAKSTDLFLSGTFPLGAKTIGLIRIATMSPASTTVALQQFAGEIAFFEKNTDALLIDVTHNGGGSLCYIETLMAQLTSGSYTASNYEIRATDYWVAVFDSIRQGAIAAKADQWMIDMYGAYIKDLQGALTGNRVLTGTIPICGPVPTLTGSPTAYSKPILTLVDEFTLSAAEAFSMMLQDSGRATIMGTRTDGGGGNPAAYNATTFSEGTTRVTRTFVMRGKMVQTPGFPASQYLENTGVYPDVLDDIMTKEDLLNGGATYFGKVTKALGDLLK
jgi:hypothetical protein